MQPPDPFFTSAVVNRASLSNSSRVVASSKCLLRRWGDLKHNSFVSAGSASHSLPVTVLLSWNLLIHCPARCLPFLESMACWIKPRSTAGCRLTKPERTLEVGLMLLRSVYGNGLKRLVIHNTGKTTDLTPTWQATKCLKEKYQNWSWLGLLDVISIIWNLNT